MPFSVFLMSVSQFLLATNWLIELDFINKWKRLKNNHAALSLIALFLIHIIWMINSENLSYGWHDIRIKLPLFILPLLIGSSKNLNKIELKLILHFFLLAIVCSTFISALIYWGIIERDITDIRQISIFISHIRLALLDIMGVFIALYYFNKPIVKSINLIYLTTVIWLIFFLVILNSYTGFVVLALALMFGFLVWTLKKMTLKTLLISSISIIIIFAFSFYTIYSSVKRFYQFDELPQKENLELYTLNGNKYKHHLKHKHIENGHYVYIYVCLKELKKEWNSRSKIDFDKGLDNGGYPIKFTLLHYMSSMNLRKDSLGMTQLSDEDIRMVENGISNHIFKQPNSIYTRLYPILIQLHYYHETGYASGGTLVQRFEYLRIAFQIIKENFYFGVGTGDVDDQFKQKYRNGISNLEKEYQHRAHNQFITFFVSFGLVGFVLVFFFLIFPFYRKNIHFLTLIFFSTAFLSMLNEDTLETQAGITFFVFFHSVLLIASFKQKKSSDKIEA